VVRPGRWLHEVNRALTDVHPFGSLTAAARSAIRLIPYQLEPALAARREGRTRILIADDVGLGKTIQAGLLLLELGSSAGAFRGLVLVPAGLRDQWVHELSGQFGLSATIADAAWLRSTAADHPVDVNPWSLPGIYVSSHDFVKRPEVLRPLEAVSWDLLVVDEAHAVTGGTDRRAAIHSIAVRSRRVMLLTATPHAGDPVEFHALCDIGGDKSDGPPVIFRRHRSDVGAGAARKSILQTVIPSEPERRMHSLLERYSRQVWQEATARGDERARLASIVLRKRALSSAGSLAASVRRRLELLTSAVEPDAWQLALPIAEDEDPLEDYEPSVALAAPGLVDPNRERSWLSAIGEAARVAARAETKIRFVLRLLSRLREPAIVFTEYRDTLARLERLLAVPGRSLVLLHGGMSAPERSRAQYRFNERGGVLLATDAASEGLNLHQRCRIVVHFELPWNLSRLQQRAGRVDRLGQARRVHEIALVAADTAERLVLAPLAARAARARAMGDDAGVIDRLTESCVAEIVMAGSPSVTEPSAFHRVPSSCVTAPAPDLWLLAHQEAARLEELRTRLARSHARSLTHPDRPVIASLRSSGIPPGLYLLYVLSASTTVGHRLHAEPVLLRVQLGRHFPDAKTAERLRQLIASLTQAPDTALASLLDQQAGTMLDKIVALHLCVSERSVKREHAVAGARASAARELVQPGLFDRRSLRRAVARTREDEVGREETADRLDALAAATSIRPDAHLAAALLVRTR
jgi:superfamily II DNA or RNA helicase